MVLLYMCVSRLQASVNILLCFQEQEIELKFCIYSLCVSIHKNQSIY